MSTTLNETHDPSLRSWVISANQGGDFPVQNLPFSVFRRKDSNETFRGGVAIGDQILDLAALAQTGVLHGLAAQAATAAAQPQLNALMQLGASAWSALRHALSTLLRQGAPNQSQLRQCLVPQAEAQYKLPAQIGDYTDFYTSIYHATSVGKLFRPDNPLLPNYKWVPIGYHGRSSTIDISGQRFRRPLGQTMPKGATTPVFGPCQRLDYEVELGLFVGPGNAIGTVIPIGEAESHIFGICLLNDWSARDIQAWEYQPLGPFLAKNFATTIAPWVVTLEALAPYRTPFAHPDTDPQPMAYLDSAQNRATGGLDIQIETLLSSEKMRQHGTAAKRVSLTSYRHAYWTAAQLLVHHTINGCSLQPGDFIGTGTQSGPTPAEAGSLLELTVGGSQPIQLSETETRTFVQDGDQVIMRGWCEKPGAARIGFGQVVGEVLPATT